VRALSEDLETPPQWRREALAKAASWQAKKGNDERK
jgi:hypothetical protein